MPATPSSASAPGAGVTVNEAVLVPVVAFTCETKPVHWLKLKVFVNSTV